MTDTGDFAATTYGIQGPFGFGDDGLGFKVWFHSMTEGHRLRWNPASTGKLDGIGSATVELDTVSFNTISEMTAGSGVTIDGVLLKDGTVALDTVAFDIITEKTAGSGVTIDGVKLKDSEPYCDVINEKTAATGVTVDSVLLKDGGVTATADIDTSASLKADTIAEHTAAAGVTVDSVALKDGGITATADVDTAASIKTDTIAEHTAAAGVTIDTVLVKDDIVECSKYQLNDDNTTITEASSNLSFKDAVIEIGTVTLEQLAERGGVRIASDYASGSSTGGVQQAISDLPT